MISFFEAQNSIRILCEDWLKDQPPTSERVPLIEGLGRYLTEDLVAPLDLPLSDVSAMDGYALCAQENDLPITVSQRYTVIGESRAGLPYAGRPLAPGECIRIFTGAVVPQSSSYRLSKYVNNIYFLTKAPTLSTLSGSKGFI